MDDLGLQIAPLQLVPFSQKLVNFGERRRLDSEKSSLHVHRLIKRNVILMHQNGSASVVMQFLEATDVVDVGMGADDGLHLKFVAPEQIHDAMNFLARIEDHGFARDWISDDRAIALEQANRHGKVQEFLRNLRGRLFRHTPEYNIHLRIVRVPAKRKWRTRIENAAAASRRARLLH